MLAPRPSRNSGASIKGLYDIPTNGYVHAVNGTSLPTQWVGAADGGVHLQWGTRFWGTGTDFTTYILPEFFARGVTLYGLDEDDNPIVLDQADTPTTVAITEACYGGPLGERGSVGTLVGTGELAEITIRGLPYGPFPAAYILHPATYAFQAFRVVDNAIDLGPRYDFTFLRNDAPPGPLDFGGRPSIPSPDFVWQLHAVRICGLTDNLALMFAWTEKDGEVGQSNWLSIHVFDPFDPVTTLEDPDYPTVARQPDVLHSVASLGLTASSSLVGVARRTDTEAVMVFASGELADMQVNVIRFAPDGSVISNEVVTDGWDHLYYAATPPTLSMGPGVVHTGDVRIGTDVSFLDTPFPNRSLDSSVYYTSPTLPVDDENYFYIHGDVAENPGELSFVFRNLATDEDTRIVTSYADIDEEVAHISQTLVSGDVGYIGENLLQTKRQASIYYARNNVVTIELGAGRQAGTIRVLGEQNRLHRLPAGKS